MRKFFYSILIGIAAFFAFAGCSKPAAVSSIDVTPPTQVNYYVGDTFSLQGASITVHFTNDSTKTVTITAADVSVSNVDMTTAGSKTITVTYKEKSATFNIMVNAIALQSIEATFTPGSQIIYTSTPLNDLKQYLQVVGTNNNSSSAGTIASGNYTLSGTLTAGASTITASYNAVSATFQVNVVAVAITSYGIKTPATKIAFAYQESFNAEGLVVESIKNDGSRQDLLLANYTIDSSAYNANIEGVYTIAIKISGTSVASYTVSVTATSVQLQAAKTAKLAEITLYNEADYYASEWTALQAIKNGATSAVNALSTIATIQAYNSATINANLAAIKTKVVVDAEALAAAKVAKIAQLTLYMESNYYATEWTALQGIYSGAVGQINAKTVLAEVNSYDFATVNSAMATVKTKAIVDAEALAAAKVAKIAQLTLYAEANYYASEWLTLQSIYNGAVGQINGKTVLAEVTAYDYATVNAAMAAVKTKVVVDAEALAAAKVAKIAQLTLYAEANYYATEWIELQGIYNGAVDQINDKTIIAEVDSYDFVTVNTAMDAVKTKAEVDAAIAVELADAKVAKIAQLTVYAEANYYATEWIELQGIYNGAVDQINGKTVLAEVTAYDYAAVNAALDAVKTKAEVDAEALALAKEGVIADLDGYYALYTVTDYYPAQWIELQGIYNGAVSQINGKTIIADVTAYDVVTVDVAMAAVNTRFKIDGVDLTDAKDLQLSYLFAYFNNYAEADYYETEWSQITTLYINAVGDITGQTSTAAVEAYDVDAIDLQMMAVKTKVIIDAETLASEKLGKQADLDAAYLLYNEYDYDEPQWLLLSGIYAAVSDAIDNASTLNAIAAVDVEAAKEAMDAILDSGEYYQALQAARDLKIDQMNDYYALFDSSDYDAMHWATLQSISSDVVTALTMTATLEEVAAIDVEAAYILMQAVKTAEQVEQEAYVQTKAAQLAILDEGYALFDPLDYRLAQWNELETLYLEARQELAALTTLQEVTNFGVYPVLSLMNAIQTDEEISAWEALAPARADRVLELILPDEADYMYGDWQLILRKKQDLISDLNQALTLEAINLFDVSDYQVYVDDVLTISETVVQKIANLESESMLNRTLTNDELIALPFIINLMQEYQYKYQLYLESLGVNTRGPGSSNPEFEYIGFEDASIAYIKLILDRSLSQDELDALVVFHRVTNEMQLLEYRNELLNFVAEIVDEDMFLFVEPLLRAQDFAAARDFYDTVLLQAEALFNQYRMMEVLPDNIHLLFLRAQDDFINQIRFIQFENEALDAELDYFLLLNDDGLGNYTDINDDYLSYVRDDESRTQLYLEGILEAIAGHYWLTVGFLVPEGFVYETYGNDQSNISLFLQQNIDMVDTWVYTPIPQGLTTIDNQRYLVLKFDLGLYTDNMAVTLRLVFGENLFDALETMYSEEDLPGRAISTTTIRLDFSEVWLDENTIFVDSLLGLEAALAVPTADVIYLRSGIYEITADMEIDGKAVFIGLNAVFKNMEGSTLTIKGGGLLHNGGHIYNYGMLAIEESGALENDGFAYNFGDMDMQGGMYGSGQGYNLLDYSGVDAAFIAQLVDESYIAPANEAALLLAAHYLRTYNFGYLPLFDESWGDLSAQAKADYFTGEFTFELTPIMLANLVDYYDYLAPLYENAMAQASSDRIFELQAYRLQWYLGATDVYTTQLATALKIKAAFELNGGTDFEKADVGYIEYILNRPLDSDEINAFFEYRNIYHYLIARDFVVHFLIDYDVAATIHVKDFKNLSDVSEKIIALFAMRDDGTFSFDVAEASALLGDDFEPSEEAGYLYYLSYYTYANFEAYILGYETALERELSDQEYRALSFYYGLMVRYEEKNDFEESYFSEFELVDVEQFYNQTFDQEMTKAQKDNWFTAKSLEIIVEMLIPALGELPDQATLDAVPLILRLQYEYDYWSRYSEDMPKRMEDATNEEIAFILGRSLTEEEEAALVIFASIQLQVMDYMIETMYIPVFEEMLNLTFTPEEVVVLKIFFYLQMEYENAADKYAPEIMDMNNYLVNIEEVLGRLLSMDEKEAVLFMRFLFLNQMMEQELGEAYTPDHVAAIKTMLVLREEFAYAWSLLEAAEFSQELMENTNADIALVLQRSLTQSETDALIFIHQFMAEPR